ncbi:MAG: 7-carboxy-7-deazaguanine synthase [Deltaproteobacteria bacterium]
MVYAVKELFFTLQGEGARAGRASVFVRFAGCNLWNGREEDRSTAVCRFCDTDFVGTDGDGGGRFESALALAQSARAAWGSREGRPYVVCTGGEPLLQLDAPLVDALHDAGFEIAIETNGTIEPPRGVDWICVSPKAGGALAIRSGHELKLVYPQPDAEPARFAELSFEHFFLQPMDDLLRKQNTERAVAYCLEHPRWRLSLQTHKLLGIR